MEIVELQNEDKSAWDEFVLGSEHATIFQFSGWMDVMKDSFGLSSLFLIVKENGQIIGGLPLLHVKNILSGHYFTSMPGGICARDEGTAYALLDYAKDLIRKNDADYLILRDSRQKWDLPDLVTNEENCTFIIQLCENPDQEWKTIDRRIRQHVDKAINQACEVYISPDQLDAFYHAYSKVMHDMGTPTLGLSFFQNVFAKFPEHFKTIMVQCHESSYGGIVAAFFQDTIYMIWWGLPREFYKNHICHYLNWETMKYGCINGFCHVDMGRSKKDSGAFHFKERWPAEPCPVYQQFFLNNCSKPPSVGMDMDKHLKYRLFCRVWKRLPLKVTEVVGPQLRRGIPFG